MYEVFDHTADLGLRIRAATREELFAEAARGLVSLIVANPDGIHLVDSLTITVPANNDDYLLFDWLNELLYLFETERFLPGKFHIQMGSDGLVATCEGERLDPTRHLLEHEVKAITYHGLLVQAVDGGWLAEVILDI